MASGNRDNATLYIAYCVSYAVIFPVALWGSLLHIDLSCYQALEILRSLSFGALGFCAFVFRAIPDHQS